MSFLRVSGRNPCLAHCGFPLKNAAGMTFLKIKNYICILICNFIFLFELSLDHLNPLFVSSSYDDAPDDGFYNTP